MAVPAPRISSDEKLELAIDDLVQLAATLPQLDIVPSGADRVDVRLHSRTGWSATVLAYDAVGDGKVAELLAANTGGETIVVANRISEPARRRLAAAGWSWLDRRIGAHLAAGDRDIEVRLPAGGAERTAGAPLLRRATPAADGPIRGRAGIAYAAAVLREPDRPPSLRSVAAAVGMSPTAIGNAVERLVDAGLLDEEKQPTTPELFWALAEVWSPVQVVAVATLPDPPPGDQLDQTGWVLGGDAAAIELGAPLFATEIRPWFWVPTQAALRRAERALGSASWEHRAAVVAVPPTPLVCQRRRPPRADGSGWPLPHPVFAALDLARDPGRGREILERWTPEGAVRVWER